MTILTSNHPNSQSALPRDFAEFLNWIPIGGKFNLWNLQGALRFTRKGFPAEQAFAEEIGMAESIGLIRELREDKEVTAHYRQAYGLHLRYGATYVKARSRRHRRKSVL